MRANAQASLEDLESTWSVDSYSARLASANRCESSFLADTSYTLVRAGSARVFHARGISLGKSLCKVADSFEPYPTDIPYMERGTCGTCTSSGW
jgi:hypothetical protein